MSRSIKHDGDTSLYVLYLESISLADLPVVPIDCAVHWYVGNDAHDSSINLRLSKRTADLKYCVFVLVSKNTEPEDTKVCLTITSLAGQHLGVHFCALPDLASGEHFSEHTIDLLTQDGPFATFTLHGAKQMRWTEGGNNNNAYPVEFVDPTFDSQSRHIWNYIAPKESNEDYRGCLLLAADRGPAAGGVDRDGTPDRAGSTPPSTTRADDAHGSDRHEDRYHTGAAHHRNVEDDGTPKSDVVEERLLTGLDSTNQAPRLYADSRGHSSAAPSRSISRQNSDAPMVGASAAESEQNVRMKQTAELHSEADEPRSAALKVDTAPQTPPQLAGKARQSPTQSMNDAPSLTQSTPQSPPEHILPSDDDDIGTHSGKFKLQERSPRRTSKGGKHRKSFSSRSSGSGATGSSSRAQINASPIKTSAQSTPLHVNAYIAALQGGKTMQAVTAKNARRDVRVAVSLDRKYLSVGKPPRDRHVPFSAINIRILRGSEAELEVNSTLTPNCCTLCINTDEFLTFEFKDVVHADAFVSAIEHLVREAAFEPTVVHDPKEEKRTQQPVPEPSSSKTSTRAPVTNAPPDAQAPATNSKGRSSAWPSGKGEKRVSSRERRQQTTRASGSGAIADQLQRLKEEVRQEELRRQMDQQMREIKQREEELDKREQEFRTSKVAKEEELQRMTQQAETEIRRASEMREDARLRQPGAAIGETMASTEADVADGALDDANGLWVYQDGRAPRGSMSARMMALRGLAVQQRDSEQKSAPALVQYTNTPSGATRPSFSNTRGGRVSGAQARARAAVAATAKATQSLPYHGDSGSMVDNYSETDSEARGRRWSTEIRRDLENDLAALRGAQDIRPPMKITRPSLRKSKAAVAHARQNAKREYAHPRHRASAHSPGASEMPSVFSDGAMQEEVVSPPMNGERFAPAEFQHARATPSSATRAGAPVDGARGVVPRGREERDNARLKGPDSLEYTGDPVSQKGTVEAEEKITGSSPTRTKLYFYRVLTDAIGMRAGPDYDASRTGEVLLRGTVVLVDDIVKIHNDERVYLRVADGRGWIFDDSAIDPYDPSVERITGTGAAIPPLQSRAREDGDTVRSSQLMDSNVSARSPDPTASHDSARLYGSIVSHGAYSQASQVTYGHPSLAPNTNVSLTSYGGNTSVARASSSTMMQPPHALTDAPMMPMLSSSLPASTHPRVMPPPQPSMLQYLPPPSANHFVPAHLPIQQHRALPPPSSYSVQNGLAATSFPSMEPAMQPDASQQPIARIPRPQYSQQQYAFGGTPLPMRGTTSVHQWSTGPARELPTSASPVALMDDSPFDALGQGQPRRVSRRRELRDSHVSPIVYPNSRGGAPELRPHSGSGAFGGIFVDGT